MVTLNYEKLAAAIEESGLKKGILAHKYIMYAFKHTGVAELRRSGADWLEIKEQIRHHSLDQVIQYGHSLLGKSSEHIREKGPKI